MRLKGSCFLASGATVLCNYSLHLRQHCNPRTEAGECPLHLKLPSRTSPTPVTRLAHPSSTQHPFLEEQCSSSLQNTSGVLVCMSTQPSTFSCDNQKCGAHQFADNPMEKHTLLVILRSVRIYAGVLNMNITCSEGYLLNSL
jgi:hypothetical protein